MTRRIEADTLRQWLDEQRPVTVLDIRPDDERAQWAIPGSHHVNAYEALRSGDPGPFGTFSPPAGHAVVTVCAGGRVSQTAADILSARDIDAYSLVGGMKAWSLSWNTADLPLPSSSAQVVQVRRTGKGCLSYVVGSDGDAVVIDPALPADVYVEVANRRSWRIRHVIETHIHADHLSRARSLAERTGASLLLPNQARARFAFEGVGDGDSIAVGRVVSLVAWRTPGHTAESTCYVVNDAAVFTGDTLFTRGVGRPDLHTDDAGARRQAHELYGSLARLRELSPDVLVLPGHTSQPVPFDGRPIALPMGDVLIWLSEWMSSEASFVERLVSRLPETPPNFERIIELNESGELPAADPTELEAGGNQCAIA
jgi:glyoxylase-like metal-dependent hydrolase (beta-lactamase superfamily II)/rhodanese-related sulfurtransferase